MFGAGLRDTEQHEREFGELHGAGSGAEPGDGDGQGHQRGRREQVHHGEHHGYGRAGDQCFCVTQFSFAPGGEQPRVDGDGDE